MALQNHLPRPYRWEKIYERLRGQVGEYASMPDLLETLGLPGTAEDKQVVRSTIPRIKLQAQRDGLVCVNLPGSGYALVQPGKQKKSSSKVPQGGPAPETARQEAKPERPAAKKGAAKPPVAESVITRPADKSDRKAEEILDEVLAVEQPAEAAPEAPNSGLGGDYDILYGQYGDLRRKYEELQGAHAKTATRLETLRKANIALSPKLRGYKGDLEETQAKLAETRKIVDELVVFAEELDIRLVGGWKNSGRGHHRSD